ncbi:MAG: cytochrome b/b6 domain-containing protein [Gammaproteobacteria bacterium]|nr:cytochrome b/b6 domain-containing protein [Gammaproteobacteria bacterium]
MSATTTASAGEARTSRIVRHALADRLFHWINAASVLTLLGTAFLPIMGYQFPWVTAHWIAGIVMIAAIAFHVARSLLAQNLRSMLIGPRDLADLTAITKWNLRVSGDAPPKPGKYSLAQKLIHLLFALVLIAAAVTGALMLVRIDTPWWERDPYWLSETTWGVVYVIHGLAALLLVTMVIAHVYFALRPDKLLFTRSMIRGWITREEYETHHDTNRWQVKE